MFSLTYTVLNMIYELLPETLNTHVALMTCTLRSYLDNL